MPKNAITLKDKLNGVEQVERKIKLQKANLIEQAFNSTDPNVLLKANEMLNVEHREPSDRKSYIFDPNDWNTHSGFKDKPIALTYETLRRISYAVTIIRSILNTRIDQVCDFCDIQKTKYDNGFVIRKKRGLYEDDTSKPSKTEIKEMNIIKDFIINCGADGNFEGHDFDEFTRMVLNDSLTFDQLCFEIVYDRRGKPYSYVPVDGATMRLADSYDDDDRSKLGQPQYGYKVPIKVQQRKAMRGYYPSYVQLNQNVVVSEFYPWEMCFGIRNPTTSIFSNGYGICEIETLINTITSLLWGEEYNRKFFSQGSAPKGFFKIKPNANGMGTGSGSAPNNKIMEFRQKYQSMMSGVQNAHKTPIIEADVDWIDLQKTNRDMEFSHWFEFLIKLCCAVWRIDPAEINFPLQGGSEQKSMFEGSNEARLKHSRDKGLKPLVKFYERKLNKFLVQQMFNSKYELAFMGLSDSDPDKDIDRDNKLVQFTSTIDEVRVKRGDKALGKEKGGDLVLNQVWYQFYQGQQQMQMQQQQQDQEQQGYDEQAGQQGYGQYGGGNAGDRNGYGDEDKQELPEEPEEPKQQNVFEKAFEDYFSKLMSEPVS